MGGSASTTGARANSLGIGLSTAESNRGFCYNGMMSYAFAAGNTYDIDFTFKNGEQNVIVNDNKYNSNFTGGITDAHLYLFAHDYYNANRRIFNC